MKKKVISIIISSVLLTVPLGTTSVFAEEPSFTDEFMSEDIDSSNNEISYADGEWNSSAETFVSSDEEAQEISDFSEDALLFQDGTEEGQSKAVNEEDAFVERTVELRTLPNKTAFKYGEVKSVQDFDLTGMSIKVTFGDSEEILTFSKSGERKQDSKGNFYECKVEQRDDDGDVSDSAEVNPGFYLATVTYDDGTVRGQLRVLPGDDTKNMIRQASGVYTATTDKKAFVKLVPEESGKFRILDTVKRPDEEEETDRYLSRVYDEQLFELASNSVYDLEKGKTYYIYPWDSGEGAYTYYADPVDGENSGVCGANAVWKIENGIMAITGSGPLYNYIYTDSRKWQNVEKVIIGEGITTIGNNMFADCSNLTSVQIANSVEQIGDSAFSNCVKLQSIFIPANVKKIGEFAFWRTCQLNNLEVDKNSAYYSTLDGILYNKDQTDLIFVPDSISECNISAKVTSFEGIAVNNYPYKFKAVRNFLGSENSALQKITVALENPVLASEEGVLYTKDKSILLACPPKKKALIVAQETKTIAWGAADGCKELTSVSFPDSLEYIAMDAFQGCTSLKEVVIPENTGLGGYSFTEKDVTLLKVYENSNAQEYAKTMGFKYEVIGKHTHNWAEDSVENDATCEKEGRAIYKCTLCGSRKVGTIPVKNHSWDAGVVTKAATCTENGVKTYTCSAGGEKRTEELAALGHKYGAYKITKAATTTETGIETRECSVCNAKESREIPKLASSVKLVATSLPVQVKKSVSARSLIANMASGDSITSVKTSNSKVVSVNKSTFKITAKKAGKATITITLKSGAAAKVTVNVKKGKVAATKITGIKKSVTIKKGKKLTLKPVLNPITCTEKVTYSSSNKKVATVSAKGVIKASKKGKATIKVKAGKKIVTCKVIVK